MLFFLVGFVRLSEYVEEEQEDKKERKWLDCSELADAR